MTGLPASGAGWTKWDGHASGLKTQPDLLSRADTLDSLCQIVWEAFVFWMGPGIAGIVHLLSHGEERLVAAVDKGRISERPVLIRLTAAKGR